MRYVRYIVLGALAVTMITIALANREPLTIRLLPAPLEAFLGLGWNITLPAFLILLLAVAFGILLGFVWEWIREHKHRSEAATERRRREKLEETVRREAPAKGSGDEVLAILDGR